MGNIEYLPKLLGILFLVGILVPSVTSAPSEYLFPNERLGELLATIEIDHQIFEIYGVLGSQNDDVLVIGDDKNLADDASIQKALFAYRTHVYLTNNRDAITDFYQISRNRMSDKAGSFSQQILSAFKMMPEVCYPVPDVQIISVCVKPTDSLPIMKIKKGILWGINEIPDWSLALENYRKLGGDMLTLMGTADAIRYEDVVLLHKGLTASNYFVDIAASTAGIQIENKQIIDAESVRNKVGSEASTDYKHIQDRVVALSDTEDKKRDMVSKKMENIKMAIRRLALSWGDYEQLNAERKEIIEEFEKISLEDQKFTSDFNQLDDLAAKADVLQAKSSKAVTDAEISFSERFFLSRWVLGSLGWLNSRTIT